MSETELLLRTGKGSKSPNYKEASDELVIYMDDLTTSKTELEECGLVF